MKFQDVMQSARPQLMPLDVQASMPPLYSTEHQKRDDKTAMVKFFCPWSNYTVFVVEGSPVDDAGLVQEAHDEHTADYLFFALVDNGGERELGYVSLSELVSIVHWSGLRIERDEYWEPRLISEL